MKDALVSAALMRDRQRFADKPAH